MRITVLFILCCMFLASFANTCQAEKTEQTDTATTTKHYRYSLDAVQYIYLDGVPHVDKDGWVRKEYDKEKSFLPLILYHPREYVDQAGTIPTPLDDIRKAGFNAVETTQKLTANFLDSLHRSDLRLIVCNARPETAEQFGDHPAILGWDIFDEPDHDGAFEQYPRRFELYEQFSQGIRQHDPVRPIFVNNVAWILPPNKHWWVKWQKAGDLGCHDNYPITRPTRPDSLSARIGIPESVSLSVAVLQERAPSWLIVQAFDDRHDVNKGRWFLPTPTELRAMVYTALVHGSTAINYFTFDNYVTRSAHIIGISPNPQASYDTDHDKETFRVATPQELSELRMLWKATSDINREITTLKPWLLSPTAKLRPRVYIAGESHTDMPLRALLKYHKGHYRFIVVNIDRATIDARFTWADDIDNVQRMFEPDTSVEMIGRKQYTDTFQPFAVHVYDISFSEQ